MFLPTLECLERREVFSANPATALIQTADPQDSAPSFARDYISSIVATYNGDQNFSGHEAATDFSPAANDGFHEDAVKYQWDFQADGAYEAMSVANQSPAGILASDEFFNLVGTTRTTQVQEELKRLGSNTTTEQFALNYFNRPANSSTPAIWLEGAY